jgi:hypothetical protein
MNKRRRMFQEMREREREREGAELVEGGVGVKRIL